MTEAGRHVATRPAKARAEQQGLSQGLAVLRQVLDAHAITESAKDQRLRLQWDVMHFLPIVYEQMNDLLLNTLCDERGKWVASQ